MTTRLNPNIAKALDMEMPEEEAIEDSAPLVTVEPHELVTVENENLPNLVDIEVKTLEGEKQLEQIIAKGMGMFSELYDELPGVDPKYRNRHLEVTALIMGHALDAVKMKMEYQIKRKKQRLEEAEFGGKQDNASIGTANFFGSREELLAMLNSATDVDVTPSDESE
jgi:hypothetical protein